jgi:hypothetical protein
MQKVSFQALFRNANPDALDLLDKMLAFDPSSRISVEEALEHRYLQIWHDASDEPNCPTPFDFHFEVVDEIPQMKKMILDEVARFRQLVRVQPQMANNPNAPQAPQVPVPENYDRNLGYQDPRPQETHLGGMTGLEGDLAMGTDGMQYGRWWIMVDTHDFLLGSLGMVRALGKGGWKGLLTDTQDRQLIFQEKLGVKVLADALKSVKSLWLF